VVNNSKVPKIYYIVCILSLLVTLAAGIVFLVYGLKLGVDFRGGSVLKIDFVNSRPDIVNIQQSLSSFGFKDLNISPTETKGVLIRSGEMTENIHQQLLVNLEKSFGQIDEKSFSSVGPVIGNELKQKSITAVIIVLFLVVFYIALVFRKLSRTLSPWAMGFAAIVALIHDIMIPIGVFAWLGRWQGIEISAVFVAAILTILGYSVSDTIVVFDRVRENIIRGKGNESFGAVVHRSIMQTLSRSLNTTFTVLLSLIAIYFYGGESIKYFTLALTPTVSSG